MAVNNQKNKKQFFVMIVNAITNILLSLSKVGVGFVYNSQLLIADGIHFEKISVEFRVKS